MGFGVEGVEEEGRCCLIGLFYWTDFYVRCFCFRCFWAINIGINSNRQSINTSTARVRIWSPPAVSHLVQLLSPLITSFMGLYGDKTTY